MKISILQAHKSYEACLLSNEKLINVSSLSGDDWVVIDGENKSLQTCDLQEELEKVMPLRSIP